MCMDTEQMLVHKFSYFDSITVMYFFAACICSLMAHMARLGFRFTLPKNNVSKKKQKTGDLAMLNLQAMLETMSEKKVTCGLPSESWERRGQVK